MTGVVTGGRRVDPQPVAAVPRTDPRRVAAVAHPAPTSTQVCETLARRISRLTRSRWCAVLTTDPDTHLPSGGVVHGFGPEACGPFWDNELREADVNKFVDLARRDDPIATLHGALDDQLERSPRYRGLYRGLGVCDELRLAFVSSGRCLGVGAFLRPTSHGVYTSDDVAAVRALLPDARTQLRSADRHLATDADADDATPVMLLLDAAGAITVVTAGGRDLLDDLRVEGVDRDVPGFIEIAANEVRLGQVAGAVTTRLRGRSGRWVRLHATRVEGDPGTVAVQLDALPPDDLVRILLDAYGLTPRETEIVVQLCRGASAKEIARDLHISAHTVRDHCKAIYDKADVTSRGELVAGLFSNHVLDRMHQRVRHLPTAAPAADAPVA